MTRNRLIKLIGLLAVILITIAIILSIIGNRQKKEYNFKKPKAELILPDSLREISGITVIDSSTIACIEDENGILFIYDILANTIIKQYSFYIDGDYEAICRVGADMFILRSDGSLFEIVNYASPDFKLIPYTPNVPAFDNEGLCYDDSNNRLLIACKSNPEKGHKVKDLRVIYGFDLKKKKLSNKPLFKFRLDDVKDFIESENSRHHNKKNIIDASTVKLRISDICINPVNNKFYILSAVDHLLLVFERSGKINQIIPLDHKLLRQPEGIAFLENGDMLISSEADKKQPILLRFKYKVK